MRGSLRIRREDTLRSDYLMKFFSPLSSEDKVHLLLTDGIVLDYADLMDGDCMDRVYVQRILTPYQLEKILIGSDNYPHVLILKSEVVESWSSSALQSIQDILSIKSGFYGCMIDMCIVGKPGVYQKYLGKKFYNPVDVRIVDDEGSWAEAPLP